MTRIPPSALLLSLALVATSCNSGPQPQPTQSSSSSRSAREGEYDRGYQSEAHRHHHHGSHDEASGDNWPTEGRAETEEEASNDGSGSSYRPRGGESRNMRDGAVRSQRAGRHHNSRALTATPGQFDFYLLNLSWSPEFCYGHPDAAECSLHRAFTLHGLWPQNNDGTYPEDCSEAPGPNTPSQYADLYPDPSLLEHEWQTHGTCSGLAPDQFLALARRAERSVQIPAALSKMSGQTSLTPEQIITLFTQSNPALPASSLAISCGRNYLTAVEVCLDKNLKPASCAAVKTCGANQVRVAAPQ